VNYALLQARNKAVVPAINGRPLHSLFDPQREAQRLLKHTNAGFFVLLGLGGGFVLREALSRPTTQLVFVLDADSASFRELVAKCGLAKLLDDSRVVTLLDRTAEEIYAEISGRWLPALFGGAAVFPLRARCDADKPYFDSALAAVRRAIDANGADFAAQAAFGRRWFHNIAGNLALASRVPLDFPDLTGKTALITAAGPSLDDSLPTIQRVRQGAFLLATDTSLPTLLEAGLLPDAVISIDPQHISFRHFIGRDIRAIPLFLDLSSPPLLSRLSQNTRFFAGGHPFSRWLSRHWRAFPQVDTSGGNVTFAAVSLARVLGASQIQLFGADYSYPQARIYTRAAYIHTDFRLGQNRLAPLETRYASFLYANPTLEKAGTGAAWRYETALMRGYRERMQALLEEKGEKRKEKRENGGNGNAALATLTRQIEGLPPLNGRVVDYLAGLDAGAREALAIALPLMAFVEKHRAGLSVPQVLEAARQQLLELMRQYRKRCTG
jgi:hypothetical protein